MEGNIIRIGNSKGIILPASLLKQLGLDKGSSVNIGIRNNGIFLEPGKRANWAKAAQEMNRKGEDRIIGEEIQETQEEFPW